MSSDGSGPYIGALSRFVWQWVRRHIYESVVAAGFDDLNPAHLGLFRFPTPDGRRPSELAEEMQITKQSVNDLLGHLERHGYLTREPDPSDNRSRLVRLTARGHALCDVSYAAAADAERQAGELLGEERLAELRRSLAELAERLGPPSGPLGGRPRPADEPDAPDGPHRDGAQTSLSDRGSGRTVAPPPPPPRSG